MSNNESAAACMWCVHVYLLHICESKCLNSYQGAGALLVCINRPCVRHEGRVVICLTANLQRSGERDQTGGKITAHSPKWETIIPPKVTQTQPRIRIIEQAFRCSFLLTSGSSSSSPQGAWVKWNISPFISRFIQFLHRRGFSGPRAGLEVTTKLLIF